MWAGEQTPGLGVSNAALCFKPAAQLSSRDACPCLPCRSGAKNYQEWFDFIGLVKDKRFPPVGSPFQMNFPPGPPPGTLPGQELHVGRACDFGGTQYDMPGCQLPAGGAASLLHSHRRRRPSHVTLPNLPLPFTLTEGISPLNSSIPSCSEGALACSCGDCPTAPGCEPPPPPPPPPPAGCPAVGTASLSCTDLSLAALYVGLLACLPLVVRQSRQQLAESEARRSEQQMEGEPVAELEVGSSLPRRRSSGGGGGRPEGRLVWAASDAISTAATAGSRSKADEGEAGEEDNGDDEEEEELVEWPATEQLLRQWFFHQVMRLFCTVLGNALQGASASMPRCPRRLRTGCQACMSQRACPSPLLPQGLWCARRPRLVLALSLLVVGACALGLTRFRWGGLRHGAGRAERGSWRR